MDIADIDSSAESSIENAVLKVESLVSQVDVVFHGAGISQRSAVQETKFEVYKRLIDVNYLGAVYLSLRLLPKMLAQGGGKFVVISSLVGKFGTPLRSGYAASKHALHGFFDSLRAEHPGVIDVMIVCPGFIKTNITFSAVRGDGSSYGAMGDAHSKAMSAEDFALRFMHDFNCGREEVYIGGREKFGVYLKRFFPGLFSKMVSKANVI
jgi:short-subunit dehydrogenase